MTGNQPVHVLCLTARDEIVNYQLALVTTAMTTDSTDKNTHMIIQL